jgi:predicted nucleic-acid-binding protein
VELNPPSRSAFKGSLALDTNVIVRLLVQDNEAQFAAAMQLLQAAQTQAQPLAVTSLVVLETEWVLRSRYRQTKEKIAQALTQLLECGDLKFEDEATLEEALYVWKNHAADFADCFIAAKAARLGCVRLMTFDEDLRKTCPARRIGDDSTEIATTLGAFCVSPEDVGIR